MHRVGSVIGIHPEMIEEYKRHHAAVWPRVLAAIHRANIRNYTIFLQEPENLLFSSFEYHGENYAADMARLAADPINPSWLKAVTPCQAPLETRAEGEHWASMQEVFHTD